MSLLLLKIDQRSKRTEKMVKELRKERAAGTVTPTSVHLLQEDLPVMPFNEWSELLKFENQLCSTEGTSVKQSFVKQIPFVV